MNWSYILIMIACFVVALILLRGLFNMMQDGSSNKSQQLMRLRVIAQAVAVLIMVVVVWMSRG